MIHRLACAICVTLSITATAFAQDRDPNSPAEEKRTFQVLDGFDVTLFASDPMLAKPISMQWDARGRLWLACSTTYPQIKPGQKADDQIIVLEDTDGDGVADKSTIFARGLYIPTGFALGDGGVYVADVPDILFLKDTDGDGVADVQRVVLSGFGTEDNHHALHSWVWGPGGNLYFMEGVFLHSQVETPHGLVRMENGGVFEFNPKTMSLRVFADYRAGNNWGHFIDRWGQNFLQDNSNKHFGTPLTANSRAKLAAAAIFSAHTKHCGGDIVSGHHLPAEYQGELWTNAYKTHSVDRFKFIEDGSGFAMKEEKSVLVSTGANFRAVDCKVGPDGAVYVADWYNPIINHVHDFRDPLRDHVHGRIWRITAKGQPLVPKPRLVGVGVDELLGHLKDDEDWTRNQVKRVAAEMDAREVAAGLERFVASLDPADEHARLEALWTYQTIGIVQPGLLAAVLESKDGRARAAAVRVLRYWHDQIADSVSMLERTIGDEHPRVRLETVLTLSFIPDPRSMQIAMRALDKPTDRFIEHALRLTADGLRPQWLPAFEKGTLKFATEAQKNFAMSTADSSAAAVEPLRQMLDSGAVEPRAFEALLKVVAEKGTPVELEQVVERIAGLWSGGYDVQGGMAATTLVPILNALEKAGRERGVQPKNALMVGRWLTPHRVNTEWGSKLRPWADDSVIIATCRLAGAWKIQGPRLKAMADNTEMHFPVRAAAANALGEMGDAKSLLAAKDRSLAAIGMAAIDVKQAAPIAADALSAPGGDAALVLAAFTSRKGGADALADALAKKPPTSQNAALIVQQLNVTGFQHAGLSKLFTSAGLDQRLIAEDPRKLAEDVQKLGDPARGEMIFRRANLACTNCHAIAGGGPELGPDLASIGSSSPMDYIIDSVLQPSKVIKDQYENVIVMGKDGRVIAGILAFKDDAQVVVRDATQKGREVSVPRSQVAQIVTGPSLMPPGLAGMLKDRQEFLDLARFLSELGRPGPYATPTLPIIRRWRIAGVDAPEVEIKDDAFAAAYSMTSGELPLPAEVKQRYLLLRGQVDVSTAGRAKLIINSMRGITAVWLDAKPAPTTNGEIELPAGLHWITFVIDTAARGGEGLKVQVDPAGERPARLQVVGGA